MEGDDDDDDATSKPEAVIVAGPIADPRQSTQQQQQRHTENLADKVGVDEEDEAFSRPLPPDTDSDDGKETSAGLTVGVQSQDDQPQYLLPPVAPHLRNRKCLILDLDETLVHSSFKVRTTFPYGSSAALTPWPIGPRACRFYDSGGDRRSISQHLCH